MFGDGVEGATLPTGQNNIQASYRVGLGAAGNVARRRDHDAGRPAARESAASSIRWPRPAGRTRTVADIRTNAPLTVLTLGRAVSITDYQNFAAILRRYRQGLRDLDSRRRRTAACS